MKKESKSQLLQYIKFLEKQQGSKNYKNRVSPEVFNKEQVKLDKARLKLKLLYGG